MRIEGVANTDDKKSPGENQPDNVNTNVPAVLDPDEHTTEITAAPEAVKKPVKERASEVIESLKPGADKTWIILKREVYRTWRIVRYSAKRITTGKRPAGFNLLIIALLMVYLLLELVFNTQILDVAGIHGSDLDLRTVELFGRASAGLGVTLLVIDRFVYPSDWRATISAFCLTLLIVWPIVFFGQEKIVDAYVDNASPQKVADAYFAAGVKSAAASGNLVLDSLNINAGANEDDKWQTSNKISQMTISTYMGALLLSDKTLMDAIAEHKKDIIETYAQNEAADNFDKNYEKYKDTARKMQERFAEYIVINDEFKEAIKNPEKLVNAAYTELVDLARKEAADHKAMLEARREMFRESAETTYEAMLDYEDTLYNCNSASIYCRKTAIDDYRSSTQLLDQVIEPLELIQKTHEAGLSVDSITDIYIDKFGEPKGFALKYPEWVNDEQEIIKTVAFNETAKDYFRSKGMVMPENWVVSNRQMFDRALAIFAKAKQVLYWKERMAEIGLALPPDVTWKDFQLNGVVQDFIKKEIGEDIYVYPVLAEWNNKEFHENMYKTVIKRKTTEAVNMVSAPDRYFGEGGLYEAEGRQALRAVAVPALITAISLFLVISSIINIVEAAIEGLYKKGEKMGYGARSIKFIVLILMFVLPWAAYHLHFEKRVDPTAKAMMAQSGVFGEGVMQWVITLEHIIYPTGKYVDEKLGVTQFFIDHMRDDLDDLDDWMSSDPAHKTQEKV